MTAIRKARALHDGLAELDVRIDLDAVGQLPGNRLVLSTEADLLGERLDDREPYVVAGTSADQLDDLRLCAVRRQVGPDRGAVGEEEPLGERAGHPRQGLGQRDFQLAELLEAHP